MTKKQKAQLVEQCLIAEADFKVAFAAFNEANIYAIKQAALLRKVTQRCEAAWKLKTSLETRMVEASRRYKELRKECR